MTTLRLVLGDQLTRDLASLRDMEDGDVVLMAELRDEATYVKHHKRKIAFLFSAMRHFAEDVRRSGATVDYVRLTDEGNTHSFAGEVERAAKTHGASRIVVTEAGEFRVQEMLEGLEKRTGLPVEIRTDDRFLCSHGEFADYADGTKQLRMESFYRRMRDRTGYLMVGEGDPVEGRWNFDHENREPIPKRVDVPERPDWGVDGITQEVLDLVAREFADHFGDLDGFSYPVTRRQALHALRWFVEEALPGFGTYQDAMRQGEPLLFHSHLSALMNCGLLTAREVCDAAEAAYKAGDVPINAAEGFIRQIIGWREFVRGVYWRQMPDYGEANALKATRPLPDLFWTGETKMNCLAQCVGETKAYAYAHHIQRLMVLGNFCLLGGFDPREVQEWYLVVYHDAYEWVEMPNVVGMILFADKGLFASKPYAASGNYINKMSDYCGRCHYDVKKREGEEACPFNYLYWDFLDRHRDTLGQNHRLSRIYGNLDRMGEARVKTIRADARRFLDALPSDGDY